MYSIMYSISSGKIITATAMSKDTRVTNIEERKNTFAESSSDFGNIIANWYEKVEKITSIPDTATKS
jgi:hypothetical protein